MHTTGLPDLVLLLLVLVLLAGGKRLTDVAQGLAEAIDKFRGGGGGTPSHPIPSNDSALLLRKRRKKDHD